MVLIALERSSATKGGEAWLDGSPRWRSRPGLVAPGSALAAETTKLEANAAATPLGIDDAKPKLSWRLEGAERGLAQSKYRIVVATTDARAAAGDGNVWDSGEVTSANPYAEYAGPALASRTRYHWAVRGTDVTGWSAPS